MAHKTFHDLHSFIYCPTLSSTTLFFIHFLQPHWPSCHSSDLPGALPHYDLCTNCSLPENLLSQIPSGSFLYLSQDFAHLSSFYWRLLGCQTRLLLLKFVLEVLINAIWQEKGIRDTIINKLVHSSLSFV